MSRVRPAAARVHLPSANFQMSLGFRDRQRIFLAITSFALNEVDSFLLFNLDQYQYLSR